MGGGVVSFNGPVMGSVNVNIVENFGEPCNEPSGECPEVPTDPMVHKFYAKLQEESCNGILDWRQNHPTDEDARRYLESEDEISITDRCDQDYLIEKLHEKLDYCRG
jgi:hypothetical protein